nr:immunoglobulin light chain junction region [Macaca mulatta]MOW63728.1 immunoglobulin light chain junction region [Macaca mulatta]MOW64043.1 immunoglobulin light chain junction region [Macaca mulatta]MOW65244.1 immunoglobulin light chain junction region [Macaca mulatta]MOW65792.1 immunoglobulin light chain junction region [Macaca mulatta]
CQKYTTSPFNF